MSLTDLQQRARVALESERSGKTCIFIDTGTFGAAAGSIPTFERLAEAVAEQKLDAHIIQAGSLGWREVEPLVAIARPGRPRIYYRNVTPAIAGELIAGVIAGQGLREDLALAVDGPDRLDGIPSLAGLTFFAAQKRASLRNAGLLDPEDINDSLAHGGYQGLGRALAMTREALLDEVETAGLRTPSGTVAARWRTCCETEATERMVIVNAVLAPPVGAGQVSANEILLEGDPHAVLEGLLIAAYAAGSSHAYLCIDPNDRVALHRVEVALQQMRSAQLVGENILGSEFSCEIELFPAPGDFTSGEPTALIETLEGRPAQARVRPPFPETAGLHSKPTIVASVETLALLSAILQKDAAWFRSLAVGDSSGTRIVTVDGPLARTGFAELPMGATVAWIVNEIAGAVLPPSQLKTVQIGGSAGGWLPAAGLDIAFDDQQLAEAGCTLSTGSLRAADTTACAVDLAMQASTAACRASCGKCSFGREGTHQLAQVLTEISIGRGTRADIDLLLDLADCMKAGSLCSNGVHAADAVLTLLRHFPAEFDAHLNAKHCAAGVCGIHPAKAVLQ